MLKQVWEQIPNKIPAIIAYVLVLVVIVKTIMDRHFVLLLCGVALLLSLLVIDFRMARLVVKLARLRGKDRKGLTRPTVYVCRLVPGLRAVCPEKDFLLAKERQERMKEARTLSGERSLDIRISPDVMLIFPLTASKVADMGSFGIENGPAAFAAITAGCNVVYCEMFVPATQHSMRSHGRYPISLEAGWQLIHGRPMPVNRF